MSKRKLSERTKHKISESNKHKHNMTEEGRRALSESHKGVPPSNKGKICISNIELNKKIYIKPSDFDKYAQDGWIKGDIFSRRNINWWQISENRELHRLKTSIGTRKAMQRPEIKEKLKKDAQHRKAIFMKNKRKGWKDMSLYEALLYDFLSNANFIYEKKHKINGVWYVSDFCNDSLKIWIEIDGKSHTSLEAIERDRIRDLNLTSSGYKVLRFKNKEVQNNLDFVKNKIMSCISEVMKNE